ncbi:alpha-L-arabinofuranosidase C-terminal domain-containing protein [Flavobacterium subsaxonicum]|uniref:non-reducing end alpha-L-arabinofuranosidase n=1 Tax=Flavobacterium subsaxonicum WB 4.1-42 = DSM 21790 TaxID=1121898 RepID=A0A0A2MT40_9FLAO|nr:alpha-L-arabinofuranosidase C-terminal domain-containing protein [Flavobacterium subsaxonicum]KGO94638.1 alpha-L-arabinofuranosidase [Flavobacterium subsaxonicum WB 4.1-42 = DSM 21790]
MKKFSIHTLLSLSLLLAVAFVFSAFGVKPKSKSPDKVYLFAYATEKNSGKNGLHFAWSNDKLNWYAIGNEYSFLKCDYGSWSTQKRMLDPFLFKDQNGLWHCLWSVNEADGVLAHAASKDLVNWQPQSYPLLMDKATFEDKSLGSVQDLEVTSKNGTYTLTWLSGGMGGTVFTNTTNDFKKYTETQGGLVNNRLDIRKDVRVAGEMQQGTITEVDWSVVDNLKKTVDAANYKRESNQASAKTDSVLFAKLKPLTANIVIDASQSKKISNMLMGVFFEDINYAADGGLYAELIQNRDFEYALSDKEGKDAKWNHTTAWSGTFRLDSVNAIHKNNAHYAVLINSTITNSGFDGIAVKAADKYNFSLFAKGAKCTVKLKDATGTVVAQTTISPNGYWKKYTAVLKPSKTVANAVLEISTMGETAVDMVSLFPQKTYKGRSNGLREDLAQTVAGLHPRFMRFPGGCVAHGDGIGNIYRWKNTIGPLESRVPQRNLWGYHQTVGLGYFEYFQYCEDMQSEPVPVLAAGVPCQNSAVGGAGQQFGIPMEHMDEYVQDVLDLIEYANGAVTTTWGKKRAEAGHSKPFNLKYIGIGNEDLITDVFEERYTMIVNAVKKKYPNITIIGTVGPFFEGADYVEGWKIADKLQLPMVDEHYYQTPGWFVNNQDFYDSYDRSKSKVYLGEYASWGSSVYNALAEALYLTALERNGDVVSMASYAPLLAKENHTQWNPDLVYFNNTEVKPTVNYYVQQLYGQNPGDSYIQSFTELSDNSAEVQKRIGISVVKDSKSGDVIVKLVNMLPVAVTPQMELQDITPKGPVSYTTFKGNANAKSNVLPVTAAVSLSEAVSKELAPYSFTVIRIKTK